MSYEIFGRYPNGTLTPRQGYYTPPPPLPQPPLVDPRMAVAALVGLAAGVVWSNRKTIVKEAERLRARLRGW